MCEAAEHLVVIKDGYDILDIIEPLKVELMLLDDFIDPVLDEFIINPRHKCAIFDIDLTLINSKHEVIPEMKSLLVFIKEVLQWKIGVVTARRTTGQNIFDLASYSYNEEKSPFTITELKTLGLYEHIDYVFIQPHNEPCPDIAKANARVYHSNKYNLDVVFLSGDTIWDIVDLDSSSGSCGDIQLCKKKLKFDKAKYYLCYLNGKVLLKMAKYPIDRRLLV